MTFFKYYSHSRSEDNSDDDNKRNNSSSDNNHDTDDSVDKSPRYTPIYHAFSNIYLNPCVLDRHIYPIINSDY